MTRAKSLSKQMAQRKSLRRKRIKQSINKPYECPVCSWETLYIFEKEKIISCFHCKRKWYMPLMKFNQHTVDIFNAFMDIYRQNQDVLRIKE